MALPGALTLWVDTEQRRVKRDRTPATIAGTEWNLYDSEAAFVDPVTNTAMMFPPSIGANFHETNTGRFQKLGAGDYFILTPDNWYMAPGQNPAEGDTYLTKKQGEAEVVFTETPWVQNRGLCLSFFNYNAGNSRSVAIECGWSDTHDGTVGPSFRFYADGTAEFWLDNEKKRVFRVNFPGNRQFVDLTMIPVRGREILFLLSMTEGDVLVREDIPENEENPIIFPAADFWWYVPAGESKVQIYPFDLPDTAYIYSVPYTFGRPPATGAGLVEWDGEPYRMWGSAGGAAIEVTEGATGEAPFVPNGVAQECRLKAVFTSDGFVMPCLYAAHVAFSGQFANTPDAAVDVTSLCKSAEIDVPDDPGGVRLILEFMNPGLIETAAPQFRTTTNRPVQAYVGALKIFDGVNMPSTFTDHNHDDNRRVAGEWRDRWQLLERYAFRDRMPLDGLPLSKPTGESAVAFVLRTVGISASEMDLEDVDFTLPSTPGRNSSDFNFLIEPGDTAASVLRRLHDDFAASFAMTWKPAIDDEGQPIWKFLFRDPDTLPTTPVLHLYRTPEAAYAGLVSDGMSAGDAAAKAAHYCYGELRITPLEVEANEIWCMGVDKRTGHPIQSYYVDDAAQDPETAPADRPANWSGDRLSMGVIEPRLTSQAATDRCVQYLVPLVTTKRLGAEWDTGTMLAYEAAEDVFLPVWRFDVVRLHNVSGEGGFLDFRIASLSAKFDLETTSFQHREGRYTAIQVGTGIPYGRGGRTLSDLDRMSRARAKSNVTRRPGYRELAVYGSRTAVETP